MCGLDLCPSVSGFGRYVAGFTCFWLSIIYLLFFPLSEKLLHIAPQSMGLHTPFSRTQKISGKFSRFETETGP